MARNTRHQWFSWQSFIFHGRGVRRSCGTRPLQIEPLEDRRLLAVVTQHSYARRVLLAAATIASLLAAAELSTARDIVDVVNVQIVARLTGPGSNNNTQAVAIGGTDLGHMVNHGGRTYYLFGDTFSGDTPAQGGFWRSNVMAYSTDFSPSNGITFDGWVQNTTGQAREVIYSGRTSPITEIPTGAVSINDRIYTWYMAVNWWGPPGQWTANYAGLAYWKEGDEAFTVVDSFAFPGNGNFGMVAATIRTDPLGQTDEHVYVWGTPAGRLGGVKLARVEPQDITDINAYEYFGGLDAGQPNWVQSEFDAPLIVGPTVGEMSVMYNEALQSWTMLYLNHNRYAIEIRQSPEPWGPWSDPIEVATGAQFAGLYGSYMNPLLVENGGESIYFTMSLWDSYDVYLVKASFITPSVPGDYNHNDVVDAADYVVWRNTLGQRGPGLVADGDGSNQIDVGDYDVWRAHFGQTGGSGSGASTNAAVPEPATLIMFVAALIGCSIANARQSHKLIR
jgi:hypothetical protein